LSKIIKNNVGFSSDGKRLLVSNDFMKHLDALLKKTDKPVLLWMVM